MGLDQYDSGELSLRRFETKAKQHLARAYENAYSLGSGGYIDEEFIQEALEKEYGFLRSMFRDIKNETTSMGISRRISMYADKLSSVYDAARVRDQGRGKKIYWRLGLTDKNCPGCIAMADGSPYTYKTLKTYPRAGDTQCLTNCQCELFFE